MHRAKRFHPPLSCRSLCVTRALLAVLCLCCAFWPALADAGSAGRVISLTPGAFVEHGDASLPLGVNSEVNESDVLLTDASGRMRVLFADDSSVSLAPNTRLSLTEFVMEGEKPTFKAHLGQGLMRAITGKIVEANPSGFTLSTPEAAVGIRGTILSVRSERGVTTVYVENTLRKVYVNGINVPGGQKITIPGELTPQPITPENRRSLGRELAFAGGAGVASAAPEPSRSSGEPDEKPAPLFVGNGLPAPESLLAALPLDLTTTGDTLSPPGGNPGAPGAPAPLPGGGAPMGSVSGLLGTGYGLPANVAGNFSFQVDLQSGAISNASINLAGDATPGGTPPAFPLNLAFTGGTGLADPTQFMISGFSGGGNFNSIPLDPSVAQESELYNGAFDLLAEPNGATIPVDYSIFSTSTQVYDSGTGSGTFTK